MAITIYLAMLTRNNCKDAKVKVFDNIKKEVYGWVGVCSDESGRFDKLKLEVKQSLERILKKQVGLFAK